MKPRESIQHATRERAVRWGIRAWETSLLATKERAAGEQSKAAALMLRASAYEVLAALATKAWVVVRGGRRRRASSPKEAV